MTEVLSFSEALPASENKKPPREEAKPSATAHKFN